MIYKKVIIYINGWKDVEKIRKHFKVKPFVHFVWRGTEKKKERHPINLVISFKHMHWEKAKNRILQLGYEYEQSVIY